MLMISWKRTLMLVCVAAIGSGGCDDDGGNTTTSDTANTAEDMNVDTETDATSATDATTEDDATSATDAATEEDATATDAPPDEDTAEPEAMDEGEPNNGTTDTEVTTVVAGTPVAGFVDVDDADVFFLDATPGRLYTLTLDASSALDAHLAVFDAGRSDKAAGDDFVKIAIEESGGEARMRFLAMGAGGYYIAVRDIRNTGGGSGAGGADHTYTLRITEGAPEDAVKGSLADASEGSLAFASDVDLYTFSGSEGQDIVVDLTMNADEGDGRLFVFANATQDWIARNDDRSAGDSDPLIDAFLSESGAMFLVVENIRPEATQLGYMLSATLP